MATPVMPTPEIPAPALSRQPSRIPRLLAIIALLLVLGGGLFAWGVQRFASAAIALAPAHTPEADGIVVLTGGSQRVNDGVRLLARNHGRRLLVTGAHPATGRAELARATGEARALIDCCVDIGYQALNTHGNAREAAEWARQHGFSSLIIVTSNYHMPRTLLLLRQHMPTVSLHPYPVANPRLDLEHWWTHGATARLLVGEYCKYLAALLKQGIGV